jgi:cytosine/adenosine deaminase-related metal-dependent hydrolase
MEVLTMENFLIVNANILTFGSKPKNIRKGAIYIGRGTVLDFGAEKEMMLKYSTEPNKVDAKGRVVMPGFVDFHNHLYGSFFSNIPAGEKLTGGYDDYMKKYWWNLTGKLSSDGIYYSAVKGIINSIKSGVTTIFNLHSSPNCMEESLHDIAEAFEELSMRGVLGYEISNRNGNEAADKMFKMNSEFAEEFKNNPLVTGVIGLYNANEASDQLLRSVSRFAERTKSGTVIHLSESENEDEVSVKNHDKKYCIDRLYDIGLLNSKTILSAANYIDETDIDIIKESKAGIALTPSSSFYKGFDFAPIESFIEKQIPLGFGSDGIYHSIPYEASFAHRILRQKIKGYQSGNAEIAEIITKSSYKLANSFVSKAIGEIKPGNAADLIIADYIPEHEITPENLNSHLIFGILQSRIATTIINGNIVMKDFEMVGIDEADLNQKFNESAAELNTK